MCHMAAAGYQFDSAVVEGNEFTNTPSGVRAFVKAVLWGETPLRERIFGSISGNITNSIIDSYIN